MDTSLRDLINRTTGVTGRVMGGSTRRVNGGRGEKGRSYRFGTREDMRNDIRAAFGGGK